MKESQKTPQATILGEEEEEEEVERAIVGLLAQEVKEVLPNAVTETVKIVQALALRNGLRVI